MSDDLGSSQPLAPKKKNKKRKNEDRTADSDDTKNSKREKKDNSIDPDRSHKIDDLIKEMSDIKVLSDDQMSRIKRLIDFNQRSSKFLADECGSLHTTVTKASFLSDALRVQRIRIEDEKKQFIDFYQRSYLTIYESYLQMRRLLFSRYWWDGLSNDTTPNKIAALSRYYDGTHPWCPPTTQKGSSCYHSPEQPANTIDRSSLFTKEETDERWSKLLSDDTDVVSILQLPAHTQRMLADAHQWSQTGIVDVNKLDAGLADIITEKRVMAYSMYDIRSSLKEHHRLLLDRTDYR